MDNKVQRAIANASQSGTLDLAQSKLTQLTESLLKQFPDNVRILLLNNNQLLTMPNTLATAAPNLTELHMRGNAIFALPTDISLPPGLVVLDLSLNKLASIPDSIGKLNKLQRLVLQNNKLVNIPSTINQLESLRMLYLATNRLTALPDSLCDDKSKLGAELAIFNVSDNKIAALPSNFGRKLTSLTSLNVSKNELRTLPASIGGLSSLIELIASENKINSLPSELGQLASLKRLDLGHNELTMVDEKILASLGELRSLLLNSNKLELLPGTIKNLPQLELLSLERNKLKELPPEIGFLSELKELMIDHNQLENLPGEFDMIEEKLEKFTFEYNPFCGQLPTVGSEEDVLENVDESIARKFELVVDDENEDWEMKLVLEMLIDGEAFMMHGKGRPQKIHLSVSKELKKIQWKTVIVQAQLARTNSWSASKMQEMSQPIKTKIRKGGTIKAAGVKRKTLSHADFFDSPPPKAAPAAKTPLFAPNLPKQEQGTILLADVEKVVFGKSAESEEETESNFFTIVATGGGVVLEASSPAERDEWARAFLLLLKYVTKLTLKTLAKGNKEESSSDSEEAELSPRPEKKRETKEKKKKKTRGSKAKDDSPVPGKKKKKTSSSNIEGPVARKRAQTEASTPSPTPERKDKKRSSKGSKIKAKLFRKKDKKRRKKKDKAQTPREELEQIEKQFKRQKSLLGATVEDEEVKKLMAEIRQIEEETAALEAEVIVTAKPSSDGSIELPPMPTVTGADDGSGVAPELPKTPRGDEELPPLPKTPRAGEEAAPAKAGGRKWAQAWEDIADDDEEELKKLEQEKKKKEEEEKKRKLQEEEEEKKRKQQEEEEEKKRKEEEEERRKFEEEEKKKMEEERKKREEATKKRKEDEERRKKRLEELLKQADELKKHTAKPGGEADEKHEAATIEVQEALKKLEEETQRALAEEELAKREERKEKLAQERAKTREERLGRLRAATENRSEVLKKQKEQAERQSVERKQRLIMLKEASVKRLRETTAVAEALKQKEVEAEKASREAQRQSALEMAKERIKQLENQKDGSKSLSTPITMADMKRAAMELSAKPRHESPRGPTSSMSIADKRDMLKFMSPSKRLLSMQEEETAQKLKVSGKSDTKAAGSTEPSSARTLKADSPSMIPKSSSNIDVSAMKSRARMQPGRRLPTRRRHSEDKSTEQMARQKSIPRARKIETENFNAEAVKAVSTDFSFNLANKARGLLHKGDKEPAKEPATATPAPSATPSCQSCGFQILVGSAFCTNCGTKQTGGAAPASTTSSPAKKPITANDDEKGLTEAEKIRQRIMQKKASPSATSSASGDKGDTEAERMRQRIAGGITSNEAEDMDALIERRRAESNIQKKVDAQNERDNIIANFSANAKGKKSKFKPKLVQLKGKSKVKSQVVKMAASSLNEGDAYLLYDDKMMYLWYGESANRMEKAKGAELTKRINFHECGGRHKVHIVHRAHDTDKDDDPELSKAFWERVQGSEEDVVSAEAGGNDIAFERMFYSQMTLDKIVDSGGGIFTVETVEIEKQLSAKILSSRSCYILECGPNCAYVWVGRAAPSEHRKFAVKYAKGLKKAAEWMHLEKESDGGESILFREKFCDWGDFARPYGGPSGGTTSSSSSSSSASSIRATPALKPQPTMTRVRMMSTLEKRQEERNRIDIERLHSETRGPPEMYDDGSGKLEMWVIENYELKEWPQERHGVFYSAESFVMLYTYRHGGLTGKSEQIRWLIYFWQGLDAKHQEKGAAALLIKDVVSIVKNRGGDPEQVRVDGGSEPAHFLLLFNGRMVVHKGSFVDHSKAEGQKPTLYHIHGTDDNYQARAVGVKVTSKALNSRDCFVMLNGSKQYIWHGAGSDDLTQANTKKLADVMRAGGVGKGGTNPPRDATVIQEGSEPSDWKAALDSESYANAAYLKRNKGWRPRLYMCSSLSGEFRVTRVWDYSQLDLYSSNCYMLDAWAEVYIWIGNDSYEEDERMAMETALDYVQKAIDGRLADTPIFGVYEDEEPLVFTCHFRAWNEDIKKGRIGIKEKEKKNPDHTLNVRDVLKEYSRTYTLEELKKIPKGLDKTKLEQYLSDEDFAKYFRMTKTEFYELPAWQQMNKRTEAGLK